MSRSGYSDDLDQKDLAMWRGRVMSAMRGKRGQRLLLDLRAALDAMPEKRLIADELVNADGECCALGCVGLARGMSNLHEIDPEDAEQVAKAFDIAEPLAQEIVFENDDDWGGQTSPESRWKRMRQWVESHINKPSNP